MSLMLVTYTASIAPEGPQILAQERTKLSTRLTSVCAILCSSLGMVCFSLNQVGLLT